jgi:hypothetical protein
MGTYYGIRIGEQLVAMAGERLCLTGYREISGVCTHPSHTGKGYAKLLMNGLMRDHAAAGVKSFLHPGQANTRAARIYKQMGFRLVGSIALWPVSLRSEQILPLCFVISAVLEDLIIGRAIFARIVTPFSSSDRRYQCAPSIRP